VKNLLGPTFHGIGPVIEIMIVCQRWYIIPHVSQGAITVVALIQLASPRSGNNDGRDFSGTTKGDANTLASAGMGLWDVAPGTTVVDVFIDRKCGSSASGSSGKNEEVEFDHDGKLCSVCVRVK